MDTLSRWDPFREMWTLRNAMDRLFDNALTGSADWPQSENWNLSLDVAETENEYLVKASLPGINPDDLDITFVDNTLTIKGEVKSEEETDNVRYHLRERRNGNFSRSMTLPSGIKANDIHANYDAGILTLHLPKAEEVKPKRIPVQTHKMIEGQAH